MWKTVWFEPVSNLLGRMGTLIYDVFKVTIILLIGWFIAKLIQRGITKLLKLIKIDVVGDQIGANSFLAKGGIKITLAELVGTICYWLVLLLAVTMAINSVGLTMVADLLNQIILYIPKVIAAIIVLALGMFVATFLSATVQTAAANAGIGQAKLLAKIVEVIVVVLAAVIALEQLSIGAYIGTLITVILASLGLGFALAFGLGCKELVGKMVNDAVDKIIKK